MIFADFNSKKTVRVTSYPPVPKMPAYRGSPRKRRTDDDFTPSGDKKKTKLKAKRSLRTPHHDESNTLERLIPTPSNFHNLNHPFLNEVERSDMKLRSLWQQYAVHVCSNKAVLLDAVAPSDAELKHEQQPEEEGDDADETLDEDVKPNTIVDDVSKAAAAAPAAAGSQDDDEDKINKKRKLQKRAASARFEPSLPEGAPPIKYEPYLVFGQREHCGQLEYIMSWQSGL